MNDNAIDPQQDDWEEVLQWHFAVVGLDIGQEKFQIADGISIRRIHQPPNSETISSCLSNPVAIGLIQHYANLGMLRNELVIDREYLEEEVPISELADIVVTSIGVRTQSDLFCLAACEQSWGQLQNGSGRPHSTRIENASYATSLEDPIATTDDDLHWIEGNFDSILALTTLSPFALAFESYSAQMHSCNPRIAATQIWTAIEALIEGKFQVSYSLSLLTAMLLEPRGPKCEERRLKIRSMYNKRSDIVHGRKFKGDMNAHVKESRSLLAELLCKFIEIGNLFAENEIHKLSTEVSDVSELAPLIQNK